MSDNDNRPVSPVVKTISSYLEIIVFVTVVILVGLTILGHVIIP
jgi:hypothetical protein